MFSWGPRWAPPSGWGCWGRRESRLRLARTGVNIANVNSLEHKAMMDAYDEGTRKATPAKEEPPSWPQPLPDAADVGVVPSGTESLDATGFDDDFDSSFDNDFFDNDFV